MGTRQSGVVRHGITVPRELKEQIEEFKSENWSAVAAEAFRRRLLELKALSRVKDDDAVYERLRASEEASHLTDIEWGRRKGIKWATELAVVPQLRAIQRASHACVGGSRGPWDSDQSHPCAMFASEVSPAAPDRFWSDIFVDDPEMQEPMRRHPGFVPAGFVQGFAQGSLEVLAKYEERLRSESQEEASE